MDTSYGIYSCFNPRSRAGSDSPTAPWPHAPSASIHAPARGATVREALASYDGTASIHAPARGATTIDTMSGEPGLLQSTLPRGERPNHLINQANQACFNPRSRAGSDVTTEQIRARGLSFNPRSRAGSDSDVKDDRDVWMQLQSTLPRGERRSRHAQVEEPAVLQSTLPRGERPGWPGGGCRRPQASIHAPARGATCTYCRGRR